MGVSELERRLREKERELLADIARTEEEARSAGLTGTQDFAAAAEIKDSVFKETTADWNAYTQVRDALQRIAKGTFGRCVDCGRQIEEDRLDSIPWAAYCLAHQNRRDRELASRPL